MQLYPEVQKDPVLVAEVDEERFVRAPARKVRDDIALALRLPSSLRSLPAMQGLLPLRVLLRESLVRKLGCRLIWVLPKGFCDRHLLNCFWYLGSLRAVHQFLGLRLAIKGCKVAGANDWPIRRITDQWLPSRCDEAARREGNIRLCRGAGNGADVEELRIGTVGVAAECACCRKRHDRISRVMVLGATARWLALPSTALALAEHLVSRAVEGPF
jgi:hypothetical protein